MTYYKALIKSKDNILTSLYNDFIYEIGKEYTHLGEIIVGKKGFHFCRHPKDCQLFHHFLNEKKIVICEVYPTGKLLWGGFCGKILCTDKIKIGKILSKEKIENCSTFHTEIHYGQKINFKNGVPLYHCDKIDPETGFVVPAVIYFDGSKEWYKNGKHHLDDIDPKTGFILPAVFFSDGNKQWWKDGKFHRDDIEPETGFILPGEIFPDGTKIWYKNNKIHRDDKDPETNLTLPALIFNDAKKFFLTYYTFNYDDCDYGCEISSYDDESIRFKHWYKDGKEHRDDKDPLTGLTLPSSIFINKRKIWNNEGKLHRYDVDPVTGFTFPAIIYEKGTKEWCKNGKLHRDDIDPETGFIFPAIIYENFIEMILNQKLV